VAPVTLEIGASWLLGRIGSGANWL